MNKRFASRRASEHFVLKNTFRLIEKSLFFFLPAPNSIIGMFCQLSRLITRKANKLKCLHAEIQIIESEKKQ